MSKSLPYTLAVVDPAAVTITKNNPRTVDENDVDFKDLLAGERRLRAARRATLGSVPVLDYGAIDDDVAFEVTFNENFRHKHLKPLEAGRAVAMLMDRHQNDVAVVAARLGQSRHWVTEHAQVERGLSADWKKEAAGNERFAAWTVGHWIEIARLPVPLQDKALKKFLDSTISKPLV